MPPTDEPSDKHPESQEATSGPVNANKKSSEKPAEKLPETREEAGGLINAGKSHSDEPAKKLPELFEIALVPVNVAKKLFAGAEKRWGRIWAIVLVAVFVLVAMPLSIWLAWPELKEIPGIEQLAEWLGEKLTPIPTCSGQNFCVAVADLQNDSNNKIGGWIVDAVENLQDIASPQATKGQGASTGIEVIHIPSTTTLSIC